MKIKANLFGRRPLPRRVRSSFPSSAESDVASSRITRRTIRRSLCSTSRSCQWISLSARVACNLALCHTIARRDSADPGRRHSASRPFRADRAADGVHAQSECRSLPLSSTGKPDTVPERRRNAAPAAAIVGSAAKAAEHALEHCQSGRAVLGSLHGRCLEGSTTSISFPRILDIGTGSGQ